MAVGQLLNLLPGFVAIRRNDAGHLHLELLEERLLERRQGAIVRLTRGLARPLLERPQTRQLRDGGPRLLQRAPLLLAAGL